MLQRITHQLKNALDIGVGEVFVVKKYSES